MTVKLITFKSTSESIKIIELIDSTYGCYIWPSALVLSCWIMRHFATVITTTTTNTAPTATPTATLTIFPNTLVSHCSIPNDPTTNTTTIYTNSTNTTINMLEIGAGIGLPSLLWSKLKLGKVVCSDSSQHPQILANLMNSFKLNCLDNYTVISLDWGSDTTQIENIDLILGSDVFYSPPDFEPLLKTLSLLLKINPTASFVTAYQERSSKRSLTPLLTRYGLKGEFIPFNCDWEEEFGVEVLKDEGFQSIDYNDDAINSVFLFRVSLIKPNDSQMG